MEDLLGRIVAGARERFPMAVSEPAEAFGEVSLDVARDRIADVGKILCLIHKYEPTRPEPIAVGGVWV
jgi:hypothetical protein